MILIMCGSIYDRYFYATMTFSKSFGYAIRGIIYIVMKEYEGKNVQLDEIADTLNVPRYFLAKVMNRIVKAGILNSTKGHSGGFCCNETTLYTSLLRIAESVGELNEADNCVLRFRACNGTNPCILHKKIEPLRLKWKNFLSKTNIKDLLDEQPGGLIESITIS